jgi:hypothetical protein
MRGLLGGTSFWFLQAIVSSSVIVIIRCVVSYVSTSDCQQLSSYCEVEGQVD